MLRRGHTNLIATPGTAQWSQRARWPPPCPGARRASTREQWRQRLWEWPRETRRSGPRTQHWQQHMAAWGWGQQRRWCSRQRREPCRRGHWPRPRRWTSCWQTRPRFTSFCSNEWTGRKEVKAQRRRKRRATSLNPSSSWQSRRSPLLCSRQPFPANAASARG